MTAPFFLARTRALESGDVVSVGGSEAHHATRVRRLRLGEEVVLTDGRGLVVEGLVQQVSRDQLTVAVLNRRRAPSPQPLVTVVQALAKGDRGERAVELMTEVGVDVVVPWSAAHSVVRWDAERSRRATARWAKTAAEAAKQARRPWALRVDEAVETEQVQRLVGEADTALLLDERAVHPIGEVDPVCAGQLVLVVGPEGGLSDLERDALASAGALPVRMGPTVMRTSTAGAVAAAVLLAASPRWLETP